MLNHDITKQDVIEVVQRKARQAGGTLTLNAIRYDPEMPSPYIIAKFYPSITDLLTDAGIELSEAQERAVIGHQNRK